MAGVSEAITQNPLLDPGPSLLLAGLSGHPGSSPQLQGGPFGAPSRRMESAHLIFQLALWRPFHPSYNLTHL